MKRRGGKCEGAGRKKSPALAKITREINQKQWRANYHYIYLENRVFSSRRKVRAKGTFANDSNFALMAARFGAQTKTRRVSTSFFIYLERNVLNISISFVE